MAVELIKEPTKILIISDGAQTGKDSVADILTKFGFKCLASSSFATSRVMMPYFESIGKAYETEEACFADRMNHRALWYEKIEAYNEPTWNRISREMFEDGYSVYIGMRSPKEFEASRDLYDHILFVDASERVAAEDRSSNGMTKDMATYILNNNGPEENLEGEVYKFIQVTNSTPGSNGGGWDYEHILQKRRDHAHTAYDSLSPDELIAKIVELETALYPVAVTLGSIVEKEFHTGEKPIGDDSGHSVVDDHDTDLLEYGEVVDAIDNGSETRTVLEYTITKTPEDLTVNYVWQDVVEVQNTPEAIKEFITEPEIFEEPEVQAEQPSEEDVIEQPAPETDTASEITEEL